MRATNSPTIPPPPSHSHLPAATASITTVRTSRSRSHPTALKALDHEKASREHHYQKNATKYWDKFYKRHQDKFFKDRHYLEKDWGCFFAEDDLSPNGKVVLEVGCGSGSTLFPLMAAFPSIYLHACDFSPQAISLLKSNVNFREDRVNAFVLDVAHQDICDNVDPCSVDVVTLVFMLSAVSPRKVTLVLQNIKRVIKVKLQDKDRMIGEDFYVRGDGTCSFYFSEEFLSTLFFRAGFTTVDMNRYCRQIYNRSRNVMMDRRWIRAVFKNF